jgi:hypothetical protein
MVTLLLAAADEPSKVPFYIAGALLAGWAVVLAGIGLSRASFPYNERGQNAVIGVSLVLVVATIAMAIKTSAFPK